MMRLKVMSARTESVKERKKERRKKKKKKRKKEDEHVLSWEAEQVIQVEEAVDPVMAGERDRG